MLGLLKITISRVNERDIYNSTSLPYMMVLFLSSRYTIEEEIYCASHLNELTNPNTMENTHDKTQDQI